MPNPEADSWGEANTSKGEKMGIEGDKERVQPQGSHTSLSIGVVGGLPGFIGEVRHRKQTDYYKGERLKKKPSQTPLSAKNQSWVRVDQSREKRVGRGAWFSSCRGCTLKVQEAETGGPESSQKKKTKRVKKEKEPRDHLPG